MLTASTFNGTIILSSLSGGTTMANSELSKLKILFMYDYFMKHLNAFDDSSVTVNDIINYLEEKTGTTFERKSIYADISRINEFVNKIGKVKGADAWISTEGKRYKRNELANEITIDEARLIVDAISTTAFVDTAVCDKVIDLFPTCFGSGYQTTLYPHDEKIKSKMISYLNQLREGKENKQSLKITYGYKLGNALTETSEKVISPVELDWTNNCYYVIAIDNAAAKGLERDQELTQALKRYRLDRIGNVSVSNEPYISYKSEKIRKQELSSFILNSVSAFSSSEHVPVEITIKGKTRKDAMIAYSAFASRINHDIMIKNDTKLEKGILEIYVVTGLVPTLFTAIFELSTIKNVEIELMNDNVRKKYAEYIRKAAEAAKLSKL